LRCAHCGDEAPARQGICRSCGRPMTPELGEIAPPKLDHDSDGARKPIRFLKQ
jgi:hypothetical protein